MTEDSPAPQKVEAKLSSASVGANKAVLLTVPFDTPHKASRKGGVDLTMGFHVELDEAHMRQSLTMGSSVSEDVTDGSTSECRRRPFSEDASTVRQTPITQGLEEPCTSRTSCPTSCDEVARKRDSARSVFVMPAALICPVSKCGTASRQASKAA